MVTIAELLEWHPQAIDSLAEYFYDKRRILLRLPDEIHDGRPPETWEGLGTASAWKTYDAKRIRLNDLAAQISDLAVTLKETGMEVKGAQDDLRAILDQASGEGYTVNHQTGEVKPPEVEPLETREGEFLEPDLEAQKAHDRAIIENKARAEEFAERIDKALKRAEMADAGLAKSMADVVSDETKGGSGSIKDAAASQLPPSLDGMTPEEIAEKFGNEIAVDTMMAFLELGIPVYKGVTLDFDGTAQYRVMQNGDVKMSLKFGAGAGVGVDEALKLGAGVGGFSEFELTFKSKEEAETFLAGLDDVAKEAALPSGGAPVTPSSVGLKIAAYINEHDVTSAKVGLYGKGEFGFETPYIEGKVDGRTEGWYDAEREEYGVKVEGSVGGKVGVGETGVKAGGSFDFSGEVKTDDEGEPKEITLQGALTGEMANQKFGLNLPGVGSGAGGDVELKMDNQNVMWGEMQGALKEGDIERAAEIAMDHGSVVVRATEVTRGDQDLGIGEGGIKQTSSQHTWVRPPNVTEFVDFDPSTRPTPDDGSVGKR